MSKSYNNYSFIPEMLTWLVLSLRVFAITANFYPDSPLQDEEVSYIVIGGGSAGAVVANRLSEQTCFTVLLLEAGPAPTLDSDIPSLSVILNARYDWGLRMEKQDNMSLGYMDERAPWARGKVLGGCSTVNGMVYSRGHKDYYDTWGSTNPGWSFDQVLPYFLKSEDAHLTNPDPGYHATGGLLGVQELNYKTESSNAFVRAGVEIGLKNPIDYNGVSQIGVSHFQATQQNNRRGSTERQYLRPFKYRANLKILTNSHVTKIVIDPVTKEAKGVEYRHDSLGNFRAWARNEVILSAGTLHSPQLLMLSGIGPKDQLDQFGIPVIANSPVGRQLRDHYAFLGLTYTLNQSISTNFFELINPINYALLFALNADKLSGTYFGEATAFFGDSPQAKPECEVLHINFCPSSFPYPFNDAARRAYLRFSDTIYDSLWRPVEGKPCIQPVPIILHPKSVGQVELKSADPFDAPKLMGNYYTDPGGSDFATMLRCIRSGQKMMNTAAMKKYGAKAGPGRIPGCNGTKYDTDEYWLCAIRYLTGSAQHELGTCKMGPENDASAVVDEKCRVYGVKKLRVVDASVIPFTLAAHTNAPVIMVAEKVSDLIKQVWNCP